MWILLAVLLNLRSIQGLTTGHEVYGLVGSEFHVQTSLPVDYQILVTDEGTFPISKAGLCSTKLFQCQIAKGGMEERTLTLKGTMNERLTYIYLLSDKDLIPTTIYFFNNNAWSESTSALINPTYSTPLVRHRVPKNTTVILTCFIKRWLGGFQLFTTAQKVLYYSTTHFGYEWDNSISTYPHILKVAHKNNDNGKVIDIEVTSNGSTDYYTCNYGGDWLTHVIHWEEPITTTTARAYVTTPTTTTTTTTETTFATKGKSVFQINEDAASMSLIQDNSGLHVGKIVGITIGAVCAVALLTACTLFAWRQTLKSTDGKRRDVERWKSKSKPNQPSAV
ncbi:conserved hypothetical protein [Echinococcus multilocularis]|uniref:Uncharacterized protein n=1 Tax=Echinococcus multilocularis TaxID=6211 RepID=A0A068Y7C3_ECHMU|nr:conserved hypothetical protein [Echinococcus multilocularis]